MTTVMLRPLSLVLLPIAALMTTACPFPFGDIPCTDLAAFSVNVTVSDEADAVVDDADVVFSVDGGAEQACDNLGGGGYACGTEIEGDFVVTARKDGFVDAVSGTVTVEKDADGCHVVGESVALTLIANDG